MRRRHPHMVAEVDRHLHMAESDSLSNLFKPDRFRSSWLSNWLIGRGFVVIRVAVDVYIYAAVSWLPHVSTGVRESVKELGLHKTGLLAKCKCSHPTWQQTVVNRHLLPFFYILHNNNMPFVYSAFSLLKLAQSALLYILVSLADLLHPSPPQLPGSTHQLTCFKTPWVIKVPLPSLSIARYSFYGWVNRGTIVITHSQGGMVFDEPTGFDGTQTHDLFVVGSPTRLTIQPFQPDINVRIVANLYFWPRP